jgi:ATP-dependent DNA helicase RecG
VVPTVAGLLLFGMCAQVRLPQATVKCAYFYGQHQGADLRDRADAVGPLPRLIDEAAAFVARNRRLVPRMQGIRRVDVPEYPDYSVREAIANAVAHRDRSLEGAKVRLFMFDDRMEIWSPGKRPAPMTLERLGYDQFSRNRVIARVLLEFGYIEEVGLGIRRMREEMARLGLAEPTFREDGFSFVITFRSVAPREGTRASVDPFHALLERGEISERQYRGLLYTAEHGTIARRAYVQVTGGSERTAARDFAALVDKGLLEVAGGRGRSMAYRLRGTIAP